MVIIFNEAFHKLLEISQKVALMKFPEKLLKCCSKKNKKKNSFVPLFLDLSGAEICK